MVLYFFLFFSPLFLFAAMPLTHSVYVWQRAHTPAVSAAISNHAASFETIIVLAAEVSWKKIGDHATPQITLVTPDWTTLRAAPRVGLALRINTYSGSFTRADESIRSLITLAHDLLATATTHGVAITEFQIDYHASTATLAGYRLWLESLQAAIAIPLTFTALPAWLSSPEFPRLAQAADRYVLQVHSLERPGAATDTFTLCDPVAAQRAIARADRIGVPFQVALPTYGYTLAFDPNGRFVGLVAEGPTPDWPATVVRREVRADSTALAKLVEAVSASAPANLTGFIWYRLPITGDQRNWSWPTLAAVMAGRPPTVQLHASTKSPRSGLHDLILINDGDADFIGPVRATVHWANTRSVSADALNGFTLTTTDPTALQIKASHCRLPARSRRIMGWVRLADPTVSPNVSLEN